MMRFAGTGRVSLALLLGLTACATSSTPGARPSPTASQPSPTGSPSSVPRPASAGPAPSEWLADIAATRSSLYVATHSCPGMLAAGLCTITTRFGMPVELEAYPLTLWRYDAAGWSRLGQPGVFSYSDLMVLPGAVMLVPRTRADGTATGPLRISADGGKTWSDWMIPDQRHRCREEYISRRSGPCTVAVAGQHVVVASNYGWIRRSLKDSDWEDITPPERAPRNKYDTLGYGVLGLDDGTLVATVDSSDGEPGGYYLVSKDGGLTWGGRQANPGGAWQVERTDGASLYARCRRGPPEPEDVASDSESECGLYRSADLRSWTKVGAADWSLACRGQRRLAADSRRVTVEAVRVGRDVYAIARVPYRLGREAMRKDLRSLDLPHQAANMLERSEDGCRTWTDVIR